MKRLLLLRHAKSDRNARLEDIDRPLNARGREAAPKMAAAMLDHGFVPDAVFVSPSERTRQTWALISPLIGKAAGAAEYPKKLYLASAAQILDLIQNIPAAVGRPLFVGHNPGMEDLALRLASKHRSKNAESALERMHAKFPTCALAVLDFEIDDWKALRGGTGALVAFLTPATLET